MESFAAFFFISHNPPSGKFVLEEIFRERNGKAVNLSGSLDLQVSDKVVSRLSISGGA